MAAGPRELAEPAAVAEDGRLAAEDVVLDHGRRNAIPPAGWAAA